MDRNAELQWNLDRIALALEDAKPGEVAGLLRERRITLDAIGESGVRGGVRDEVKRKREARRERAAKAASSSA